MAELQVCVRNGEADADTCALYKKDKRMKMMNFSDFEKGESTGFYGSRLVMKVFKDLLASAEKEVESLWCAQKSTEKGEVKLHYGLMKRERTEKSINSRLQDNVDVYCRVCGDESVQFVKATKPKKYLLIENVDPNPPMLYWSETPVNIPTPDSKYLLNIPFLGDDGKKGSDAFSEKLLEMYDGKLFSDEVQIIYQWNGKVDLVELIHILMEISIVYGDDIFSHQEPVSCGLGRQIKKVSSEEFERFYDRVRNGYSKENVLRRPSMKIFEAVCYTLLDEIQPEDLFKRYIRLSQQQYPECFKPINIVSKNIDDTDNCIVQSKGVCMDSYKYLFCKLCFKYACIQHSLLSKNEIDAMLSVAKLQRVDSAAAEKKIAAFKKSNIINEPQQCTFEDCYKISKEATVPARLSKEGKKSLSTILSKWTANERTMFNCLYDSFKDYCMVATLLGTKTCRDVMHYHRYSQLKRSEEGSDVMIKAKANCDGLTKTCSDSSCSSSGYESMFPSSDMLSDEESDGDNTAELGTFIPCSHEDGVCDDDCSCVSKNKFCESSCGCLKSCKNRFKGCVCVTTCNTKRCPCFVALRECDPDLCRRCGSHELDMNKVSCRNIAVQRRLGKPMYVKKSTVSGLGAFAGSAIKKGEFIDEYTGEVISADEAEKRGHIYDEVMHTFLFELTQDLNLDASRIGSKSRFINSSKRPNCEAFKLKVRGEIRLGVRALRDIEKDEELFINYHGIIMKTKYNNNRKQMLKRKYVCK